MANPVPLSALETELRDDVKKRSYPLPVSGMDDNVGLDSNGALVHQWNEAAPHTNKHPLMLYIPLHLLKEHQPELERKTA